MEMEGGKGTLNIDSNVLEVNITDFGKVDYSIQLNQQPLKLIAGVDYTISFDIYSKNSQSIVCALQQNYSPYDHYFSKNIALTTKYTHHEFKFTSTADDDNVSFIFNMRNWAGRSIDSNTIYLKDVSIKGKNGIVQVVKKQILVN